MALPKPVYDFLSNIKIPFFGMFSLGVGTSIACSLGLLPASWAQRASILGVVSGTATIAVSVPLIIEDDRQIKEASRRLDLLRPSQGAANPVPRAGGASDSDVERSLLEPPVRTTTLIAEQLREQPGKPVACRGCRHYLGHTYRSHWEDAEKTIVTQLVCGVHPYGPSSENCSDWEGLLLDYYLIRLQGSGLPCLYFVRIDLSKPVEEAIANGIEIDFVDDADKVKTLCRKFNRKSVNGLPGCIFRSSEPNIELAFQKLLDSCVE